MVHLRYPNIQLRASLVQWLGSQTSLETKRPMNSSCVLNIKPAGWPWASLSLLLLYKAGNGKWNLVKKTAKIPHSHKDQRWLEGTHTNKPKKACSSTSFWPLGKKALEQKPFATKTIHLDSYQMLIMYLLIILSDTHFSPMFWQIYYASITIVKTCI